MSDGHELPVGEQHAHVAFGCHGVSRIELRLDGVFEQAHDHDLRPVVQHGVPTALVAQLEREETVFGVQ
jgi:hypothetical protein